MSSQIYITIVCVSSCLAGKVAVILSWGGSVFVSRLLRYWLGLGGMGLIMASGVVVRHSIAIKYTLIGIVVFDYISFPIFTHNGDDTLPNQIMFAAF